jgi:hypothetical protein
MELNDILPTRPQDFPLFGERGAPLTEEVMKELAHRLSDASQSPRRWRQYERYRILNHDIRLSVEARLEEQYKSEVVRKGTERFITRALNPAVDACSLVCQVYRSGVRRTLKGIDGEKLESFLQLYKEAQIGAVGSEINRIGFFCGPLFAFPQVRSKLMRVDMILPHRREIVLDAENPTGWPVAIAYRDISKTSKPHVILVTYDAAREYMIDGGTLVPTGAEKPLKGEEYNATPFPCLRFDAPLDPCDWDNSHKQERLADIAKDVCVVASVLGYTRSTQHQWLLVLAGRIANMPKGQNLANPAQPIMIELTQNETATIQALKFDTPVDHFADHIRLWYAAAGDAVGVPSVVNGEGSNIDLEFAYDGLTEFRNDQISFAEGFELELAVAMVQAALDGGHPLAEKLPSVEEVRKSFRVMFGRMARRFSDPKEERDHTDWEIRHGLTGIVDVLADRHKTVDDPKELLDQMRSTLEQNAELWDWMAARNMKNGVDADGKAMTLPQQNGAQGPAVRDANNPKDDNAAP